MKTTHPPNRGFIAAKFLKFDNANGYATTVTKTTVGAAITTA